MTFANNFQKVERITFDFRKYKNFFYNLNDNEANRDIIDNATHRYTSVLSQFP